MDSLTRGALVRGQKIHFSPISPAPKPTPTRPSRTLRLSLPQTPKSRISRVTASSGSSISSNPPDDRNSVLTRNLRSTAGALILTATTAVALLAGKFSLSPARAEPSAPTPPATEEGIGGEEIGEAEAKPSSSSPLSQFLESNTDAFEALRSLLYEKLEDGEYPEALRILDRLIAARPSETEWKFLASRVHNEMGETGESRRLLEEILAADPLSFEALFENAVLMDRCGEGDAAIERLERALETAREEGKEKEARDVRLIMAQMQFLQKKVEESLSSYEALAREDPRDYRPYFCQGVIYSLLDLNQEAREKFAKYKELCPRKFEVEGFLQTPLSRVKLFGVPTGDSEA